MQTIPQGSFRPNRIRRPMTWYEQFVTRSFTKLIFNCWRKGKKRGTSPATLSLHWFGHELLKSPTDLWVYQEMISELRPDWIIEAGTYRGGSALYLASLLDLLGHGQIATIDPFEYEGRPKHDRIHYLKGSSIDDSIVNQVQRLVGKSRCLVILDGDHARDHVIQELNIYRQFIHPSDYLIVEDSCVNGNPVFRRHGPGPMEAIESFLKEDGCFRSDPEMERFLLTLNPRGFLKRVA